MPFASTLIVNWLQHRFLALHRRILGRPADFYIQKRKFQALPESLRTKCAICGYDMARVNLVDAWVVQSCSAFGLNTYRSDKLNLWLSEALSKTKPNDLSLESG